MEKVRIEDLQVGMIVGKTIFAPNGAILIKEKAVLTQSILSKLKELGLPAAYVITSADGTRPDDLVSEATRIDLVRSLSKLDSEVRAGKDLNIISSKQSLYTLIDEIISNPKSLLGMTDIRLHGDYIYGHSVNVCTISVKIGIHLGYNQLKLAELGVGALFHDIGMTKIPLRILDKTSNLTNDEVKLIQTHPEIGFGMLKDNPAISMVSAHVAYQHHERYDGSGYPRGIAGDAIHEFAKITAVADVYDSMTTEKIYRPAKSVSETVAYIQSKRGIEFDPEIVDILKQIIL
jgi:HD-GYP domain-containing protein (c-di-GMP phosphodiesterase class II)